MNLQTRAASLSPDPIVVFESLVGQHDTCFLLETLGEAGRSYIGVAPTRHFRAHGGQLYINGRHVHTSDPYTALKKYLPSDPKPSRHYSGGLVGYLSHEALQYSEPTCSFPYARDFPDFEFGLYDDGLSFEAGRPPQYFWRDHDRAAYYERQSPPLPKLRVEYTGTAKSRSQYDQMVASARRDIRNGRVFQVVLANRHEYRFAGNLLALYKELRRINPSEFMFFIKFGDRVTLGASPELLTHVIPNGRVSIEALAGTVRRGANADEDRRLVRRMLSDEKEIAEHNMLVDLVRNDLGRVSRIGSVQIERLQYVKRLSHVHNLCSLVSGELAAGEDMFSAVRSTFPTGTLVGAPKLEAAAMICELEGYERGPYGGSVGYFGYGGEAVHAVNIRSVQATGERLLLHSGSGIVYDSQAAREFQEITAKKHAMDQAMRVFLGAGPL